MTEDITIRSEASMDFFAEGFIKNGVEVGRRLIPIDAVIWTDSEPIALERKASGDFIRSMKDGSLWDQLIAMKEFTTRDKSYLLIEDWDWPFVLKYTKMNRHSIVSALYKSTKFVNIVPTLGKTHTFELIQDMLEDVLRKYKDKKLYTLRPSARKSLSSAEQAQYIMEGFPGIGGAKSRDIRQNTSSLWNFLEAVNYKTDSIKFLKKDLIDNIKKICMEDWKINK